MNISLASTPGFCFLIAEFIFLHSLLMSRRSPRKKAISPEIILDSDDEDFAAVASDDPYVASFLFGWSWMSNFHLFFWVSPYRNDEKDDSGLQLTKDKGRSLQDGRGKAIVKHSSKHVAAVRKNRAASPEVQSNDDDDMWVASIDLILFLLTLSQNCDYSTTHAFSCQGGGREEACNCQLWLWRRWWCLCPQVWYLSCLKQYLF